MTNADEINYHAIEHHPKNAFQFFKVMMRLEYALKASKFVRATNSGLVVEWDDYIKARLAKNFFEDVKETEIACTLISAPPSRQVLNDEKILGFRSCKPPISNAELIAAIRRLRNNLFHGGKSGDPDQGRNDELIEQALAVIDLVLKTDGCLRQKFEGLY